MNKGAIMLVALMLGYGIASLLVWGFLLGFAFLIMRHL